jgi:predicted porin
MMIRGISMMPSRTALAAAAGLLMGANAYSPAYAADLGGGCCSDLEERVAELEATTARKGNRVVSLQVYGQVNKALLLWDDGKDSDTYVVDNDYSGSRVGFTGSAKLREGWKAGFLVELDVQDAASNVVDQGPDKVTTVSGATGAFHAPAGDDPADQLEIRYSNVYIESERYGRVTLGQGSTTADGASEVVLGNSLSRVNLDTGNNFIIRTTTVGGASNSSGVKLSGFVDSFDGDREDVIRYDSPSIAGFILSASWGDNDYTDVAVRYKNEWNSIRVAAAVAYIWDRSNIGGNTDPLVDITSTARGAHEDVNILIGSFSIMHIPTGIYGAFAAGKADAQDKGTTGTNFNSTTVVTAAVTDPNTGENADYWYAQLGIERKFLPYGSTTLYGEYGKYNDVAVLTDQSVTGLGRVTSSEASRWGLGIVQKFDSAALELYAQYQNFSFDVTTQQGDVDLEDISTIMIGSRIKF